MRSLDSSLHREFVFEALAVAPDGCRGECPSAALKRELAVVLFDTTVQIQLVPLLGVTDVIERKVVLAGPKERHGIEPLAPAQDIPRRRLSLGLGSHPVLVADI